jgi:predicted O-linked N-acetylglucosamine transferase (SPINDLY family)
MTDTPPPAVEPAVMPAQALQQAAAAYGAGDWKQAERLCREILGAHADHFGALSLLGIIAAQTRRGAEAAALLARAVALRPDDPAALNNYGQVLLQLERFAEARDQFDRALELRPDYAEASDSRGNALISLGRPAEALASYERALAIRPELAEAHNHRGNALKELARHAEAFESYQRALALRPRYPEALNNRGVALQALERHGEALASYEGALGIRPDYVEACYNRATALRSLGRLEEAVAAYDRTLELRPDFANAHYNRGNALRDLGRIPEALASYDRALDLKPGFPDAWNNRGEALRELKRFSEALDSYQRTLQLKPDYPWLYGTWLCTRARLNEWHGLDSQIAELLARVGRGEQVTPPFPVLALADRPSEQRRAAEIWVTQSAPVGARLPPTPKRDRRERIRLGYYSADFHAHATAYLAAELFERHDRSRFELSALSFGPETGDAMRHRLAGAFDRFIDVRSRSSREIAQLSRELEIDIAIDLKGFTQHERSAIFSYRAAPIQVSYLGYPGTMGAPCIDYLIADHTLIPPESRVHYSEKIVYLPHSYQVNDAKRVIAAREYSRPELGLPPRGFVFCCFNSAYKITPTLFDSWMRLLAQVESSVLWLMEDTPAAADNLRREAQARAVRPERLVFARPMALGEHLARHRAADLFLDTLPCNAHTTASDALWAGLPVLTRMGESFAARVAASLLTAIGLPELVTTTLADYEAKAIELATQPARLEEIRRRLERNRLTSPLFDIRLYTRHLEEAYRKIYDRYHAGLKPEHIDVSGTMQ